MENKMGYDPKRTINGTYGEVWLDGDLVREATALKMHVELKYATIPMCGSLATHEKVSGLEGTGSIKMNKVNSRMAIKISDMIKAGKTPSFTVISKLADPDAYGAERVVAKDCKFSSFDLANWEANKMGEENQNFKFSDWEFLDLIGTEEM